MYGSSFTMATVRPRASRIAPREAAAMPFPNEETTPPVTKTKRLMGLKGIPPDKNNTCRCAGSTGEQTIKSGGSVPDESQPFGAWRAGLAACVHPEVTGRHQLLAGEQQRQLLALAERNALVLQQTFEGARGSAGPRAQPLAAASGAHRQLRGKPRGVDQTVCRKHQFETPAPARQGEPPR